MTGELDLSEIGRGGLVRAVASRVGEELSRLDRLEARVAALEKAAAAKET